MRTDAIGFFWQDVPVVREKKEGPPKREKPEATWEDMNYLPGLDYALAFDPIMMDFKEFIGVAAKDEFVFDYEVYKNFVCVSFQSMLTGKLIYFELSDWSPSYDKIFFRYILQHATLVGFNSIKYDMVIANLMLNGCSPAQMKIASDLMIKAEYSAQDVYKHFKIKSADRLKLNQIDLIEVAPLRASLKIYGGRLHTPFMQDLPFHEATTLTWEQSRIVKLYNFKDLVHTRFLRLGLEPQVALRYQMSNEYGIDLRSRSDAQIAETVISEELTKALGYYPKQPEIAPGTVYRYKDPKFLTFKTDLMKWVFQQCLNAEFVVGEHGSIVMPQNLADLEVPIRDGVYRMGIGGLHSSESKRSHIATDDVRILDRDVTSYYPYLILNQGLYPSHLGIHFLVVYRAIVERRVAAKEKGIACGKAGDKVGEAQWKAVAESLKIVVNGSYGKLGSKYSVLYAPDLLIQTTITGQLSLLSLIERMELAGITVISANTDGVTMKVPKNLQLVYEAIIKDWEIETRFETEETEYLAMYSRDVNNYVALKKPKKAGDKVELKGKGAFGNPWADSSRIEPWLHKNPTSQICMDAVKALLVDRVPVEETIRNSKDITKFISVRTVSGEKDVVSGACVVTRGDYKNRTASEKIALIRHYGWQETEGKPGRWSDVTEEGVSLDDAYRSCVRPQTVEFLGKAIRWYYATGRDEYEIVTTKSGSKVPRSDGAKPCMDLPTEFPSDIDYQWYLDETQSLLQDIAYA